MDNFKQQPWYRLNIDMTNAINPNFDFDNYGNIFKLQDGVPKKAAWWKVDTSNINKFLSPIWINKFEKLIGYKLNYALIFYRSEASLGKCHIDYDSMTGKPLAYAINWCPKLDDADMVWYNDTSDKFTKELLSAGNGEAKYTEYLLTEIDNTVISRCKIGSTLTLVNNGIPHNVELNTTERWSISLRLNSTISSWKDAVEHFKPFII